MRKIGPHLGRTLLSVVVLAEEYGTFKLFDNIEIEV